MLSELITDKLFFLIVHNLINHLKCVVTQLYIDLVN